MFHDISTTSKDHLCESLFPPPSGISASHHLCRHQEHEPRASCSVLSEQPNNTLKSLSASVALHLAGGSITSGSKVITAPAPAVSALAGAVGAHVALAADEAAVILIKILLVLQVLLVPSF